MNNQLNIELLPLGTCAANKTPYQKFASYLLKLKHNDKEIQILMDAGNERSADLDIISKNCLKIVIISHKHQDHIFHIGSLIKKLSKAGRTAPLFVICHKDTWVRASQIIMVKNTGKIPDFVKFRDIGFRRRFSKYKNLKKTSENHKFNLKFGETNRFSVDISAKHAIHCTDAMVFKLVFNVFNSTLENSTLDNKKKKVSLVYSPDTRYRSEYLVDFVRNVDYWMLDTTFSDEELDKYIKKQDRMQGHSSPRYSAIMCEKAHVKNYVVTHYFWERFGDTYPEAIENIKETASKYYKGNILVLKDMKPIRLNFKSQNIDKKRK